MIHPATKKTNPAHWSIAVSAINAISIVLFIIIFVNYPEIDMLGICKQYHINNITFSLFLIGLVLLGIWLIPHFKIIAMCIFILFFIIFKTQYMYVELFTDVQQPSQLTSQETEVAKQFLIKQIESDPNKTNLEKAEIDNIISTYFNTSDKLKSLYDFNVAALVNNPLPGDQKLSS